MGLKEIYHRLRGRSELYQLYSNITYSTPEKCLKYHGMIVPEREEVPSVSGCDFEVLAFPVGELADYREKRVRMEELADREIDRREIFRSAEECLDDGDYDEAVAEFERSVKLDEFIPELEELAEKYVEGLPPGVLDRLRKVFVLGYKEKFGQKRYERLPERMRENRKQAGLERIKELFD